MRNMQSSFPLSMAQDITVSFGDTLLRKSDIMLLQGPCWLNDSLISFYFEYLESEYLGSSSNILCVSPQVTQCIKISPVSEIGIFLEPLQAHNKSLILFALNDNELTNCVGGSHWSLLAFSKRECRVFHFDSSSGSNRDQAEDFSKKILLYFHLPYSPVCEMNCLQQANGYDCGIHVLCNAELLIEYFKTYKKVQGFPSTSADTVMHHRSKMLRIIVNIINKPRLHD